MWGLIICLPLGPIHNFMTTRDDFGDHASLKQRERLKPFSLFQFHPFCKSAILLCGTPC